MSAEQVVAVRFGITSDLPSTLQRYIWAPRSKVGVGKVDPKMNAEQIVALRFGITQCPLCLGSSVKGWCGHW